MATQTDNIPGSGYGNPYIDALIWGAAWTNIQTPIRYYFGTGYVPVEWSSTGSDFTGESWESYETAAFSNAMSQFSAVCNLTFTAGTNSGSGADIVWWQTDLGNGLLGMHEIPNAAWTPIYGYFNNYNDSWTSSGLQLGGYGYITVIHEIAHGLGLAHPHDGGGESDSSTFPGVTVDVSEDTGDFALNQGIWSIMSYNDGWIEAQSPLGTFQTYSYGWQKTPMAFDVAALQALYGINTSYQTGTNSYALPQFNTNGTGWACIWDAGGSDTISNAGGSTSATIDLRAAPLTGANAGGYVSRVSGIWGGYTIANGAVIENAIGGNAGDTLIGNDVANTFTGNNGNDNITGGGGNDTAVYRATAASYTLGYSNGTITVLHKSAGIDGTDTLNSVEILDFTDRDLNLVTFNTFAYLAANTDLLSAWGANTGLATQHYVTNGFQENRATTFDGLRYIASHTDLMNAFGLNADAATQHYATNGFAEGRAISFNPFKYLAANTDLLNAWGANTSLGTQHYITNGRFEGRSTDFQGLSYIASYADLMGAFGLNADIATQHYVTNGFAEGRRVSFDPFKYLASNHDLLNAWGANTNLATQHYITNGFNEGRSMAFDGLRYIATYGDLITGFGLNSTTATQHYVTNGFAEGRRALFDAEFYLAKHTDLRAAFGTNTTVATQHFITNGFFEGRMSTNGGADTLIGSSSADRLNGGASKDTMTGLGGSDTFVFTALSDTTNNSATADIITDFVSGLDKIDLSGIDANTDGGGNEAFTSLIASGASFTAAGQLRLTDGVLYGNTNGEAGAEFAIVLTGVNAVTLSDFVL